ncbi:MAG: hypothetical protein QNJ55_36530 [Xenococcus sp. MO_188.B8]|nr:hypothetical protein [Xenococcus sp. MO_188.B8]
MYDERYSYHKNALLLFDYLDPHRILIPWPSLYETLNTRFVRRENWLADFKAVINNKNTIHVQEKNINIMQLSQFFLQSKSYKKYSLVNLIIREILLDVDLRIDALITFNIADFEDICWKRNIELFDS